MWVKAVRVIRCHQSKTNHGHQRKDRQMANSNDMTSGIFEALKTAQAGFATGPIFGSQGMHFWQAQDQFLKEAEKFSSTWFKRRHDATRAALETSKQLTDGVMGDPAGALKAIADWQSHSMERLAEDVKDCAEMMTHCAGALVSNEVEAMQETAETAKRALKTSKSEPV
jgi:hypothetical protein